MLIVTALGMEILRKKETKNKDKYKNKRKLKMQMGDANKILTVISVHIILNLRNVRRLF